MSEECCDLIMVCRNVFTTPFCKDVMKLIENQPSQNPHLLDTTWRRCTIVGTLGQSHGDFIKRLHDIFDIYKLKHGGIGFLNLCTRVELPSVVRYESATEKPQQFTEHCDAFNSESATRQISVIAYLNDVGDGGETVFPRQKVSIRPACGTVILFPSNFLFSHESKPPISNSKYVIVTWIHFGEETKHHTIPF
jgi:hypothetical protein